MNKISLYVLLILIFLGLSKSFSPSEKKTLYVANEQVFSDTFPGSPVSVILMDSFRTGFLIKTYFQKYKIVHGFRIPREIVVRTSKEFWEENLKNEGMSLFRRKDISYYNKKSKKKNKYTSELDPLENESSIPMPPGFLYLDDRAFGRWRLKNSGEKVWTFHRAYRHFPKMFGWGTFRPSHTFYEKAQIFLTGERAFYGLNNEFGPEGQITKAFLQHNVKRTEKIIDFKKHLKALIWVPSWENKDE